MPSSPISDSQYLQDLQAFFADPSSQTLIQQMFTDLPDAMQQWLAKLCLLYGVPFDNLVIDDRMLPQESIRFFYVDHNWLDSLVDGVFSIGVHSSKNAALVQSVVTAIRETVDTTMPLIRNSLRGVPPPAQVPIGGTMTGFLLRSAAVSGWPGLEVKAYADDTDQNPIPLLRMDRVAPDIMVCIFSGVPARVSINEPSEGLHFGIEDDDDITLRGVGYGNYQAGFPLNSPPVQATYRLDSKGQKTRVVDVYQTQAHLQAALIHQGALAAQQTLGPADFAIQMVDAPEQQSFEQAIASA
ncbi:MAG: hypothetical protein QOD75_1891 [Blastocatellia bacterium]|jgi:hypothetical protein|nr:hypothetical protein [Blastocatellia bacterium]